MQEDNRLVKRLKCGDKDSLSKIYDRYKDDLFTVAISLLQDASAAEDVVHDVFVSFVEGIKDLEVRRSLRQYLITCVVNRSRKSFRKDGKGIGLDQIGHVVSNYSNPEHLAVSREEMLLVTSALAKIPFKQRETIIMHLKGQMKFREIAAVFECPISTVLQRYQYGLNKLRSLINKEMIQ